MRKLLGAILLLLIVSCVFALNPDSLYLFDSNKLNRLKGDIGELLSEIQYDVFENSTWTRVSPHGKGTQGLDHLYLKFDEKGNIKGLLIGETKFTNTPAPEHLGITKDGIQMSDSWINSSERLADRAKTYADFAEADVLGKVAFSELTDDAINLMPIDNKGSVYFESKGNLFFYSPDDAMKDVAIRSQKATNASVYLDGAAKGKITYRKELSWITIENGDLYQTIFKPRKTVLENEINQLENFLRLDTKGSIVFKKPSYTVDTVKVGDDLVYFKENGKTYYYSSDSLLFDKTYRNKAVQDRIRSLNLEVGNTKEDDWVETTTTIIDPKRAERIVSSPDTTAALAKAYGLVDTSVLNKLSYSEKVQMISKNIDISILNKLAASNDNLIEIEKHLGMKLKDATPEDLANVYGNVEIDVDTKSRSIQNKVTSFLSEHPYKTGGIIISSVVVINAAWQLFRTGEIDVQKLAEAGIVTTVGYSVNKGMDKAAEVLTKKLIAKIDDASRLAKATKVADTAGDAIKTADAISDASSVASVAKTALPVVVQVAAEVGTDLAIYAAKMGIEYAAGAELSHEQVIDRLGIAAKYYGIAATTSAGIGAGVGAVAGALVGGLPTAGAGVGPGAAAGALAGAKFGTLILYNTVGNWWAEKRIDEEIHEKVLEEVREILANDDYARLALLAGEEFDVMLTSQ